MMRQIHWRSRCARGTSRVWTLCSVAALSVLVGASGFGQVLSAGARAANASAQATCVAPDGETVLFLSSATNLVPETPASSTVRHLYSADARGTVRLLSKTRAGALANGNVLSAALGANGVLVLETLASNLVAGVSDLNGSADVLLNVLDASGQLGEWRYLSVGANGAPAGGRSVALSADGSVVAWVQSGRVRVYTVSTDTTREVSVEGLSSVARVVEVSDDGSRVLVYGARSGGGNELVIVRLTGSSSAVEYRQNAPSGVVSMSETGDRVAVYTPTTQSVEVLDVPRGGQLVATVPTGGVPVVLNLERDRLLTTVARTEHNRTVHQLRVYRIERPQGDPTPEYEVASVDSRGGERWTQILATPNGRLMRGEVVALTMGDGAVDGDQNGVVDLFVRRLDQRVTQGITVGSAAQLSDQVSGSVWLNGDGQVAVFASAASNLVAGDTNGRQDVFLRYADGRIVRVLGNGGVEPNGHSYAPRLSVDGQYVAFVSEATNLTDAPVSGQQVYLYEVATGRVWLVSRALAGAPDENSHTLSISADGRYVAFVSGASNLVADDRNGAPDVFVYDRVAQTLQRVAPRGSEADSGSGSVSISADGQYVAFVSEATNWVDGVVGAARRVYRYHLPTGATELVSGVLTDCANPSVSGDGSFVAFEAGDGQIYGWRVADGSLELLSRNSYGIAANAPARHPQVSVDGERVAFESEATNLMAADTSVDTDVFVYDRTRGWLYAVVSADCQPGNAPSYYPVLSGDGSVVAFQTNASNLGQVPLGSNAYAVMQAVVCTPPGDVTRDGSVDDSDLLEVLFRFGASGELCSDLTFDGVVDDGDLLVVLFQFGVSCASAGFVYGDGSSGRAPLGQLYPELFAEGAWVVVEGGEDVIEYRYTSMTPRVVKSLERQAREIEMMHQGLWPYPVAGLGSEPWVAAYGDPLQMSPAQLEAVRRQLLPPAGGEAGDFAPASSTFQYSTSREVRLGNNDINVSAFGSFYVFGTCIGGGQLQAEARGHADVKFLALSVRLAEAFGQARAQNASVTLQGYFRLGGQTIWSYGPQSFSTSWTHASASYGGSNPDIGPWTRSWGFEQTFWLGIVPVRVSAGISFEAGAHYRLHASLFPVYAEARFRPYVRSNAYASGGLGFSIICSASAGVFCQLQLINNTIETLATMQLGEQNGRCCLFINTAINNTISALSGRFGLFAEACCWGLNGPGCGWWRRRQRWEWTVFNWSGTSSSGPLWQWSHTHCF